MESLIMDESFNFAPDFQLNHVSNTTSSSSSIGEEDHDESFDDDDEVNSSTGPLQDMSSLLQQLPFKRGLSKHYNGKSQSFTSLLNVTCLEDLAKPENPLNKKLKTCKSYAVFPRSNKRSSANNVSSSGFASVVNVGAANASLSSSNNNCNNNKPPT